VLVLGKLSASRNDVLMVWRKVPCEGEGAMKVDDAKRIHEEAVRAARREILADRELEKKYSFSNNFPFVPESSDLCPPDHDFDCERGTIVIQRIWKKIQELLALRFPQVSVGIYCEKYGQKTPMSEAAENLDRWFDLSHCSWCVVVLADDVRSARDGETVCCTSGLCDILRRRGGNMKKYCLAAHPFLSTATWTHGEHNFVAYGQQEQTSAVVVKDQFYSAFAHIFWGLRSHESPFGKCRFASALALPAGLSEGAVRKNGDGVGRYITKEGEFEKLRTFLNECLKEARSGSCALRAERTHLMICGTSDRPTIGSLVSGLARQTAETLRLLIEEGVIAIYSSEELWGRAHRLMENWTDLLGRLCNSRRAAGAVGLSMRQVVAATIADTLLQLLFSGSEDAEGRRLLTACGMQRKFEASCPLLPAIDFAPDGGYIGADYELLIPIVRCILSQSMDVLVHDRVRRRVADLIDWRVALDQLFQGGSAADTGEGVTHFLRVYAVPALLEDLARKTNRSFGDIFDTPIRGQDMRELLRQRSEGEMWNRLRALHTVAEENGPGTKFVLDNAVVSVEQISSILVRAALEDLGMFAGYFVFPALIRALEARRRQYEERVHYRVDGDLCRYLSAAIRHEGWILFPRFNGSGKVLCGRRFVRVVEKGLVATGGPSAAKRVRTVETASPEELAEWCCALFHQARDRLVTATARQKLQFLSTMAFDAFAGKLPHAPATDKEKKAYVMCAMHHVLGGRLQPLTHSEWDFIYKRYYGQWKIPDYKIRPFWLQEFEFEGGAKVLFEERTVGQEGLYPLYPWPGGMVEE